MIVQRSGHLPRFRYRRFAGLGQPGPWSLLRSILFYLLPHSYHFLSRISSESQSFSHAFWSKSNLLHLPPLMVILTCSPREGFPEGWATEKVRNPAGGPGRARQFEGVGGANLNRFAQQEDSAALQPIRTGVFHPCAQLAFALYQMTPWGQIRGPPAPARGRGAEGPRKDTAMWRSRGHKPSPETPSLLLS